MGVGKSQRRPHADPTRFQCFSLLLWQYKIHFFNVGRLHRSPVVCIISLGIDETRGTTATRPFLDLCLLPRTRAVSVYGFQGSVQRK